MKNYLIIEQGNEKECRIIESVILNDRYSLEHYWKKILQVFYNGQEKKYIHRLSIRYLKIPGKKTSGLYPRCYRNDSNLKCGNHCHCCPLNDIVYAFVIRNDTLRIYHYGTLLFTTDRRTAKIWKFLPLQSIEYFRGDLHTGDGANDDISDNILLYHARRAMLYHNSRSVALRFTFSTVLLAICGILILHSSDVSSAIQSCFIAMY